MNKVTVGLLDSGIAPELSTAVRAARSFIDECENPLEDKIEHATPLSRIIQQRAPDVEFVVAKVFDERPVTTAVVIAEALQWLEQQQVDVINMSFGLREDRDVLRAACQSAVESGCVLVAATPAMGEAVYPASYPGVISVTGDGRCRPGEISRLGKHLADFGACPYWCKEDQQQKLAGGASFAVPYVCGLLVEMLESDKDSVEAVEYLKRYCSWG